MTVEQYVRRIADEAPPLTDVQRARLAAIARAAAGGST